MMGYTKFIFTAYIMVVTIIYALNQQSCTFVFAPPNSVLPIFLGLFLGSTLKIFIIFKLILTISHNIIVPNTKGPFSLVLIYNIINSSACKLKFHKTVIIHKCETTFMKTTLLNAYESQPCGKPHD